MTDKLSSKERLLSAINHSEADHVPFCQKFWQRKYLSNHADGWRDQFERIAKTTRLGLDDTVGFDIPRAFSPEVKITRRKETLPGESHAFLFQEYETPKGTLKQIVNQTTDWPHGDNVPIFTDYVVPRGRSKKYLVETIDDVEALSCLFSEPSEVQLRKFEDHVNQVRNFARQNEILVECGATLTNPEWIDGDSIFLGDALGWLCGLENSVIMSVKNPHLLHALLDVISNWSLQSIRLITQFGGCDMIVHRGWYEYYWSPKLFRTFLAPRIRKEVDLAHRAGAKYCYVMTTGIAPLLDIFKEMEIDILYGVDPVQGSADLAKIKDSIRDRICIWGGVNSAVTLTGNTQGVEKAVDYAVRMLAPKGGFILGAIDTLYEDTVWDNFMTMVRTWRRGYQVS
jgi:uroporphyrinogen decarboxylase